MRNFTILAVLSSFLFVNSAFAVVEISDGSVKSLYHFEDVVDSSGNSKNFTQSGGSFAAGKLNDAYYTDTTGQLTATSTAWDLSGDYSIGFWLNIPSGSSGFDTGIVGRQKAPANLNTDGFGYAYFCTTAGYQEFTHEVNGASCPVNYSQSYSAATWYWILAVRKGTKIDFYVNNSLTAGGITENKTSNTVADLTVNGVNGGAKDNYYIDELFMINTAIDTSTRELLYNSGSGNEICVTEGCGESAPSSTPSSTTNGTSTMTEFETMLSYYLLFGTIIAGAVIAYKLMI